MLKAIHKRNNQLNDYCNSIGRAPEEVKRFLLLYGHTAEIAYFSIDGFHDVIGAYQEIGIEEFIIIYPFLKRHFSIFEQISNEEIPKMRISVSQLKG